VDKIDGASKLEEKQDEF